MRLFPVEQAAFTVRRQTQRSVELNGDHCNAVVDLFSSADVHAR
jgi:hypothetical protein